jgi:hypothetical protein
VTATLGDADLVFVDLVDQSVFIVDAVTSVCQAAFGRVEPSGWADLVQAAMYTADQI